MDLVKSVSVDGALETPAMRLGGAMGNGARARGGEGSGLAGCGADGDRAATLPERRVR